MKESALDLLTRYAKEARLLAGEGAGELERQLREGVEGSLALTKEGEVDVGRPPATAESDAEALREFAFEPGAALCLSGFGYKSVLFHAGALLRMNEAGLLPHLSRVTSVSASSITAGLLGLRWGELAFDSDGVAREFESQILTPLLELAGSTVDYAPATLLRPGRHLSRSLEKKLFGPATLQDLPDDPRFLINATNLRTGAAWRFGKNYMGDYHVGRIAHPALPLAVAVAASAAVPTTAVRLALREDDFMPDARGDLSRPPFTREALVADGGIRDPLGLEAAYTRFQTILVSDGGGSLRPEPTNGSKLFQIARATEILADQVRALYKRQLLNSYTSELREGAYWAMRSDIRNYDVAAAIDYPPERIAQLAELPARLTKLEPRDREALVNWGYAISDAALRRHLDRTLVPSGGFPYPGA